MSIILITGASSGIGYETSKLLAQRGHKVYGAARRLENLETLVEFGVVPIYLDILKQESVYEVVNTIIKLEGKIDVLINNAGYGSLGAVEDVSLEEAQRQFDVNVFGLARLTKLVVPIMREKNNGKIINISSMGGRMTTYFGAWYHASKYALEAFSDALRMETKEFGIDVVLIEPGGIKTDWGFIAAKQLEESSIGGAYEKSAKKVAESMNRMYSGSRLSNSNIVSKAILKAIEKKRPKARYLIGYGAKPLVFLHTILPPRLFDWIVMRLA